MYIYIYVYLDVYTYHISTKPFLRYLWEPQEDCEAIAGVCAAAQSRGRRRDGSYGAVYPIWLVVWNMNFIFPYIGKKVPTD